MGWGGVACWKVTHTWRGVYYNRDRERGGEKDREGKRRREHLVVGKGGRGREMRREGFSLKRGFMSGHRTGPQGVGGSECQHYACQLSHSSRLHLYESPADPAGVPYRGCEEPPGQKVRGTLKS